MILNSKMAEYLFVRDRSNRDYYKELHNFTSDILHQKKKGRDENLQKMYLIKFSELFRDVWWRER